MDKEEAVEWGMVLMIIGFQLLLHSVGSWFVL